MRDAKHARDARQWFLAQFKFQHSVLGLNNATSVSSFQPMNISPSHAQSLTQIGFNMMIGALPTKALPMQSLSKIDPN